MCVGEAPIALPGTEDLPVSPGDVISYLVGCSRAGLQSYTPTDTDGPGTEVVAQPEPSRD